MICDCFINYTSLLQSYIYKITNKLYILFHLQFLLKLKKNFKIMDSFSKKEISIAPMMKWTDRHCRFFHRQFSKKILLYTEMIPANAIIFGKPEKFLKFNVEQHPISVQLGGSDPSVLAKASKICDSFGYDEINLNVGCPSPKVKKGRFGACLMAEPKLVKECLDKMINEVSVPVSVKCRIGIDEMDEVKGLDNFIDTILESKISKIIIHARKAYLDGLNPKQNRDVPPLNYERVKLLKSRLKGEVKIIVNGGIDNIHKSKDLLSWADGIMIGREAYRSPLFINSLNNLLSKSERDPSFLRVDIINKIVKYINESYKIDANFKMHHITRHMLGLYHGVPGGKVFRNKLNRIAQSNQNPNKILYLVDEMEEYIKARKLMVA